MPRRHNSLPNYLLDLNAVAGRKFHRDQRVTHPALEGGMKSEYVARMTLRDGLGIEFVAPKSGSKEKGR